jgi:hypothetical protein
MIQMIHALSSPLLGPVDHVSQPLKLLVELGLQMNQFDCMSSHRNRLNKSEHVKMQLVGAGKEGSILQFPADTVTPTSKIGDLGDMDRSRIPTARIRR